MDFLGPISKSLKTRSLCDLNLRKIEVVLKCALLTNQTLFMTLNIRDLFKQCSLPTKSKAYYTKTFTSSEPNMIP